jgi:hypothetical protein
MQHLKTARRDCQRAGYLQNATVMKDIHEFITCFKDEDEPEPAS